MKPAVKVENFDAIGAVFKNAAIKFFAVPQGDFALLAFGDVAAKADDVRYLAVFIELRLSAAIVPANLIF